MAVTAVNIPPVGENYHGKGIRMVTNTLYGTDADTAGTFTLFTINPGVFVHEVRTQVETALPSGITTEIGDSSVTKGWLTVALVADTVAVATGLWKTSEVSDSAGNTYGIGGGKLYDTSVACTIDAVISGALESTGKINVAVMFSEF